VHELRHSFNYHTTTVTHNAFLNTTAMVKTSADANENQLRFRLAEVIFLLTHCELEMLFTVQHITQSGSHDAEQIHVPQTANNFLRDNRIHGCPATCYFACRLYFCVFLVPSVGSNRGESVP